MMAKCPLGHEHVDVNDCYWRGLWEPGPRGTGEEPPREPEFQPTIRPEHQPADVAPKLSEQDEAAIRDQLNPEPHLTFGRPVNRQMYRDLLAELDATRADLAHTRAEAAALIQGRGKMLAFIDQEIAMWSMAEVSPNLIPSMARFIDELRQLHTMLSNGLAAPQSEQPAAPVDRSAEPTHQSWCALGRFSYSRCTCDATAPPDHQAGDGDDPDVR